MLEACVSLGLSTLLLLVPALAAEEPQPAVEPERPIRASIDRVVKQFEEERKAPCREPIEKGVPCFSALVEAHAPEYSVAASLRDFVADAKRLRPGAPSSSATLFSFDPICTGKAALKRLKGKNDVYYLYWVWDRSGEWPSLRDEPLKPGSAPAAPDFSFELIGEFHGECEAVAAYRRAQRQGRAPKR